MQFSSKKRKLSLHLTISTITVLLLIGNISVSIAGGEQRIWKRSLLPSTGFNSDCAAPIFRARAPLNPDINIDFIGLYNPDAPPQGPNRDALALTAQDCIDNGNADIATTVGPALINDFGAPDADSRLKNLRSNEVPVVSSVNGTRTFLKPHGTTAPPNPATASLPSAPLRLNEFRGVDGSLHVKCRRDGTARVKIKLKHYRPNEVLTVWAIWVSPGPDGGDYQFASRPFGGVPNILIPNRHGRAQFVRDLSYCPMVEQDDGAQLLWLDVATHLDGSVYGATPDIPRVETTVIADPDDPSATFTSPLSIGITTINRGIFRILAEKQP